MVQTIIHTHTPILSKFNTINFLENKNIYYGADNGLPRQVELYRKQKKSCFEFGNIDGLENIIKNLEGLMGTWNTAYKNIIKTCASHKKRNDKLEVSSNTEPYLEAKEKARILIEEIKENINILIAENDL